ncbi:hypothetical protein Hanom_Chr04g00360941 [Helianthus anomalus]
MLLLLSFGLYIHFGCDILFLILEKMENRRPVRWRRLSEVLKVLEAADALLLLSNPLHDLIVRDEGVNDANRQDALENRIRLRLADENNGGVTPLSAHLVTRSFPVDRRGGPSIVYQQRRRVVIPAGVAEDGEEDVNPWIVDPHLLSEYGEVLHTPYGVLDQLS